MARRHKGNFSLKHPPNITIAKEVAAAVTDRMAEGTISCRTAFALADECAATPSTIGTAIDLQEGRITRCQLGLFGYGPDETPLEGVGMVDDELKAAIRATLENGRLSCKLAWRIADDRHRSRLTVGRACESLGVRIDRCQLGAF